MKDINGIEIKVGDKVKTQQKSGGVLPPAPPQIGIVEVRTHEFLNGALQIRYRNPNRDFDQFIILKNQINEVL